MSWSVVACFVAASLGNAFLLFLVQPMFAKTVLPLLGGAPAVWAACMLFFQTALLAGYAYVHATNRLTVFRQAAIHAVVLALPMIVLPVQIPTASLFSPLYHPVAWLVSVMAVSVGLPFIVLSTTAPMLQRWFAATRHASASDPYFLYAASNAGSLLGLLAYPIVIEPALSLQRQQRLWAAGYVFAAMLVAVCAAIALRHNTARGISNPARAERVGAMRQLRWVALSFIPASLMLAVTTYLSTDVAAVPLLWIVPLAVYLLTFIVAFSARSDHIAAIVANRLPLVLLPLVLLMATKTGAPLWFMTLLHLSTFTGLSVLCHAQLAKNRPGPTQLTLFYLALAVGGALAGVFNTMLAPHLFTAVLEYPLVIGAACLMQASGGGIWETLTSPRRMARPVLSAVIAAAMIALTMSLHLESGAAIVLVGISVLVAFGTKRDPARFAIAVVLLLLTGAFARNDGWGNVVHSERTFFGVYRVSVDDERRFISLYHGTTLHGRQLLGDSVPEPKTYYHPGSPIGQLFASRASRALAVGVVGLGVGSLAAYAKPYESWTFYEIDPAVERIARTNQYFAFLSRCGKVCRVVLGDARISLALNRQQYDVLVLDAFSSDAIPIHLITREAVAAYLDHLQPDGVIAVHISNCHVALRPVLARLARDRDLVAFGSRDAVTKSDETRHGYSASDWVVLARDVASIESLVIPHQWVRLVSDEAPAWSDDFSNIWTVLQWQ